MTLFITSNRHKYLEISSALSVYGYEITWKNLKYEEIQADSTIEVSLDSAAKLSKSITEDFFIEDTGLYIDQLNGFPGPYASYVASTIGNEGILRLLSGKERGARFITIITYHRKGKLEQFFGELKGNISQEPLGTGGFGYDPIFIPAGKELTLAEMSLTEKNQISHRSIATGKFANYLSGLDEVKGDNSPTDGIK